MSARLALVSALLITGCGSGLSGTYSDGLGAIQDTFGPGGQVHVSVMGLETDLEYEVDGARVTTSPFEIRVRQ